MTMLVAGMILFFGPHLLRVVAPGLRAGLIDRLGPLGFKGLYSVLSIAGFVLLVIGYSSVRWTSPALWGPPSAGMRMAVALGMIPALVVFLAAYLPGRIRASVRHPMTAATAAWAALHLLVNGRVADVLLFGGLLAWSLVVAFDSYRRPWRPPAKAPSLAWDGAAVLAGLGAWWWLAFGGGHLLLFRMPVM
jgi:uncharacterized membrane protein